ncbi:MAG: DNA recombination protein RmuC [Dongiaceae bacterium]
MADTPLLLGLGAVLLLLVAAALAAAWRAGRGGERAAAELAGRLAQMAEAQAAREALLADRLQAQERALAQTVEQRLANLGQQVGQQLQQSAEKAGQSLAALAERLAVIDAAQKNLTDLSSQVVGLQDILSNKQARGAFGELQLEDLVKSALPQAAYLFQATLGNGRRADCLLRLPNPPGSIVIDAKFPLEAYRALLAAKDEAGGVAARRDFQNAVRAHVVAIAEKYILPGETAESALMFLPSEAVYAELHGNFPGLVEESFRRRVWIVAPNTLMATLTTVRAVLKDVQMREQAHVIQNEVGKLMEDVVRLGGRVDNLKRHFGQVEADLKDIGVSADKIVKRAETIREVEVGEASGAGAEKPLLAAIGGKSQS